MKRILVALLLTSLVVPAFGASLGTAARAVVPEQTQQIISVDYRTVGSSESAKALKERVMPDNLRRFEKAIRDIGVKPETEVDNITFVSFRTMIEDPKGKEKAKSGIRIFGVAQGQISRKKVLANLKKKGTKPAMHRKSALYPMGGGMTMTFLEVGTLLFGDKEAVKHALDVRDGEEQGLSSGSRIGGLVSDAANGPIWSVLDKAGSQYMLRSALGEASKVADYETMRNRIEGSYYTMGFGNNVSFDLNVITSDAITAATLSSLIQAGVKVKGMSAEGAEKSALDSLTVASESDKLRMRFSTDPQKFQTLLNSDLFASVAR